MAGVILHGGDSEMVVVLPPPNSIQLARSSKKIPPEWHFRQEFLGRLPWVVQPPVYLWRQGGYADGLRGSMPLCGWTPLIACGRGLNNGR